MIKKVKIIILVFMILGIAFSVINFIAIKPNLKAQLCKNGIWIDLGDGVSECTGVRDTSCIDI